MTNQDEGPMAAALVAPNDPLKKMRRLIETVREKYESLRALDGWLVDELEEEFARFAERVRGVPEGWEILASDGVVMVKKPGVGGVVVGGDYYHDSIPAEILHALALDLLAAPCPPAVSEQAAIPRCRKHGCEITHTMTDDTFCGVCRTVEQAAEIERLKAIESAVTAGKTWELAFAAGKQKGMAEIERMETSLIVANAMSDELKQERDGLREALTGVEQCFAAADVEGLQQALFETTDERLKDLITRRLLHAWAYATDALAAHPKAEPQEGEAKP